MLVPLPSSPRRFFTIVDIDAGVPLAAVGRVIRRYGVRITYVGVLPLYGRCSIARAEVFLHIPLYDSLFNYVGTHVKYGRDRLLTVPLEGPATKVAIDETLYCRRSDFILYRQRLLDTMGQTMKQPRRV